MPQDRTSANAPIYTIGLLQSVALSATNDTSRKSDRGARAVSGGGRPTEHTKGGAPRKDCGLLSECQSVSFPPRLWVRCGRRDTIHSGVLTLRPNSWRQKRTKASPNGSFYKYVQRGRFELTVGQGMATKGPTKVQARRQASQRTLMTGQKAERASYGEAPNGVVNKAPCMTGHSGSRSQTNHLGFAQRFPIHRHDCAVEGCSAGVPIKGTSDCGFKGSWAQSSGRQGSVHR